MNSRLAKFWHLFPWVLTGGSDQMELDETWRNMELWGQTANRVGMGLLHLLPFVVVVFLDKVQQGGMREAVFRENSGGQMKAEESCDGQDG